MFDHNDVTHDETIDPSDLKALAQRVFRTAKQALEDNRRINPNLILFRQGRGAIVEPPEDEIEQLLFRLLLDKAEPEAAVFVSSAWTTQHPRHVSKDDVGKAVPRPKDDPARRLVLVCRAASFTQRVALMQFYTQEPEDEGPVVWQEFEDGEPANNPAVFCGYFDKE